MNRNVRSFATVVCLISTVISGCAPTRPFYFFDDGDLSHYRGVATEIEYPDADVLRLEEVASAARPLTVANNEPNEIWDITLEEAIKNALANNKVMRTLGGLATTNFVLGAITSGPTQLPQGLITAPAGATTVYTPGIVDSDPRFGTEGALSAFDAQFTTSAFWQKNDRANNTFINGFSARQFRQDLGTFNSQISKITANGTQVFMRHNVTYEQNNNGQNFGPNGQLLSGNLFNNFWNVAVETEFRHPLLQGSGVDFNRIAGPNAVSGFYNGVVIARINVDIAMADFEAGVRNVVSDTENAYWSLYQAYRSLDANIAGRDSALQTWRKVHTEANFGRADAASEAQAREQYFLFRSRVEAALSELYRVENLLRYMMGLAATDGRLCRPIDEPTTAKLTFDWQEVNTEALARSAELRRQRWLVKRREMELIASKNFLLPRLDLNGIYRWRGFGSDLLRSDGNNGPFNNAYENLLTGNFQEWQLGATLTVPIGFRQAMAGVRNAQLQLARERSLLQEQELELSHQLANAIRDVDRDYALSQTRFNRRAAAKRRVDAVQQTFQVGTVTVDLLLEAQRLLAEAESEYFASISGYNRSITQLHLRKGSLLEYDGVVLAEGPWAGKAYFDARELARKRDAGIFMNYGFTRPNVISQGPTAQFWNANNGLPLEEELTSPGSLLNQGNGMPAVPMDETLPSSPGPTPAPAPLPATPKPAGPAGIEGKSTRFDAAPPGSNTSRAVAATVDRGNAVQQIARSVATVDAFAEPVVLYESRQSRPSIGVDRPVAVGPRV
jgi:outer membrane protein TolC